MRKPRTLAHQREVALSKRRPRIAKLKSLDQMAMDKAERHYSKSAALMAGAGKLLTDMIGATAWGTETTIDVCLELLTEAKAERDAGNVACRFAKS